MGLSWICYRYKFNLILHKIILIRKSLLPERATISLAVKPLLAKLVIRSLRSNEGEGISLFAVSKLAVVESLLPNSTVHEGPPN